jgi:hypothetical protein
MTPRQQCRGVFTLRTAMLFFGKKKRLIDYASCAG